jgi:hypothetical protein
MHSIQDEVRVIRVTGELVVQLARQVGDEAGGEKNAITGAESREGTEQLAGTVRFWVSDCIDCGTEARALSVLQEVVSHENELGDDAEDIEMNAVGLSARPDSAIGRRTSQRTSKKSQRWRTWSKGGVQAQRVSTEGKA